MYLYNTEIRFQVPRNGACLCVKISCMLMTGTLRIITCSWLFHMQTVIPLLLGYLTKLELLFLTNTPYWNELTVRLNQNQLYK